MGIWKRLWSRAFKERQSGAVVRMAQNVQDSYYAWNGKIYESDIVRACITPYVKAVGKLLATHVRQTITESGQKDTKINPDTYMRFLLEEPNPWMSGQKLQERRFEIKSQRICTDRARFERPAVAALPYRLHRSGSDSQRWPLVYPLYPCQRRSVYLPVFRSDSFGG